jgi:hypothetical protein
MLLSSEHKMKFREWRKQHYDEFFAVKRARERKKRKGQADENDSEEVGRDTSCECMDTANTT